MKSIFIILVVFFAVKAPAQNLLPNPSFEDTLNAYFQVSEWITMVSPDYFTSYDKRNRGTPQNFAGYQSANTGQAYMGLRIYSLHSSNDTKLFRTSF